MVPGSKLAPGPSPCLELLLLPAWMKEPPLFPSLGHSRMSGLTWEGEKRVLMGGRHQCPQQGAASQLLFLPVPIPSCVWGSLCGQDGFVPLLDDPKAHFLPARVLAYAHTCSRHSLELASWKNNSILREKRGSRVGAFLPSAGSCSAHIQLSGCCP